MNSIEGNANIYNTAQALGYGMPLPGNFVAAENNFVPSAINDSVNFSSFPKNVARKSDSGITTYSNVYNHQTTTAFSRKRPREAMNDNNNNSNSNNNNQFFSYSNPINFANSAQQSVATNKNCSSSFSFLGEDISLQVHQQQFDVDRLISQHMERVRVEVEERRKKQARKILEAIEIGLAKRLRAKEEEIEKIGKLNWALEEKLKSLCVENQLWRDLAHSNEATVNALRTNLEQVLAAQVKIGEEEGSAENDDLVDDAQSCCGSSGDRAPVETRRCRNCGKGESCVLLLPCRHLCLCKACGLSLHTCPICKSIKNASVNVNMSP